MFAASPNSSNPAANFFSPLSSKKKMSTGRPMVGLSCRAATATTADYYKLLSVSGGCNASGEEIKKAYRAMALRYHPDLVFDPLLKDQLTRMFVQLNAAYKTLSDPVLRREYDDSLMGFNNNAHHHHQYHRHGTRGFEVDSTVWQSQILELKRRSALRRDQSASASTSWGGRMRARNC